MARPRLILGMSSSPLAGERSSVPATSTGTGTDAQPVRAHVACTASAPPRPRWPRPKVVPPPTLQ